MVTINDYKYFQPDKNGEMPEELWSFQAFRTEQECRDWLFQHDYDADEWEIHEYCNDDIEGVTLIDEYGDEIGKIEDLSDEELLDYITDEVTNSAGSIDNLRRLQQPGESDDAYMDRLYGEAHDEVMSAISKMEQDNEFDFSSYGGNPDTEWYDEVRDDAVAQVIRWMKGEE